MKKYCKNCKWFYTLRETTTSRDFRRIDHYCDPLKKVTHGWFWAIAWDKDDMLHCEEHNEKHNCKYYKRKWWKFWVKP